MTNYKYLLIFIGIIITSCSFNSTFFAVKKQNIDSQITDLTYDTIYVNSDDRKKVFSLLFKPEKEVLGTIFFLQGSGDNVASWSTYAEHFVKEGYQVYMMEYRGFGTDTGKATHKNVLNDATHALMNLTNMETVKGSKVIILGQSYGGQIAINLTSKFPDKVATLVIEGTFTSFNDEVVYQVPFIIKPFLKVFTHSEYKSKDLIKKITGIPILIIHSREDTTVPFKMGQELYSNANSPKYFWEIKGEHIHGIEYYTQDYTKKIRMLTQSNKSNKEKTP